MRTMPAMTGKETIMQTSYHDLIELRPIAEAPVRHGEGEAFGNCLLQLDDGEWVIGRWVEDGWYEDGGLPVQPTHYALLPVTVTADRDPFALARAEQNG
jgi:hypothetical protein